MSSEMASTDRAALLALFRSTRGSGWKQNNNWSTDAPLSDWYGVRVDGEGLVVGLSLEDNNFQGSIAEEVGGLLNLEELRLNDNKLTGVIPTELGRLVTLRILYLDGNGLTSDFPRLWSEVGYRVDVHRRHLLELLGSIAEELGGLLNLEEILLNDSKLIGVMQKELGRLVKLRVLYLDGNRLTGSIPKDLGGCSTWKTFSSNATSSQEGYRRNLGGS